VPHVADRCPLERSLVVPGPHGSHLIEVRCPHWTFPLRYERLAHTPEVDRGAQ
jgi:hypothetical protein